MTVSFSLSTTTDQHAPTHCNYHNWSPHWSCMFPVLQICTMLGTKIHRCPTIVSKSDPGPTRYYEAGDWTQIWATQSQHKDNQFICSHIQTSSWCFVVSELPCSHHLRVNPSVWFYFHHLLHGMLRLPSSHAHTELVWLIHSSILMSPCGSYC